jgi:hypothetical protein
MRRRREAKSKLLAFSRQLSAITSKRESALWRQKNMAKSRNEATILFRISEGFWDAVQFSSVSRLDIRGGTPTLSPPRFEPYRLMAEG